LNEPTTWLGQLLMDMSLAANSIRVRVFAFILVVLGGAMQVISCFCHDQSLSQSVSKGGYFLAGGGLGLLKASDDDHPLPGTANVAKTISATGDTTTSVEKVVPAPEAAPSKSIS
jgi:hypothetical protein